MPWEASTSRILSEVPQSLLVWRWYACRESSRAVSLSFPPFPLCFPPKSQNLTQELVERVLMDAMSSALRATVQCRNVDGLHPIEQVAIRMGVEVVVHGGMAFGRVSASKVASPGRARVSNVSMAFSSLVLAFFSRLQASLSHVLA